jgi:hypothetical protein
MVADMTSCKKKQYVWKALMLLGFCHALQAAAADLGDPTRPMMGGNDGHLPMFAAEPARRGLQSVIISRTRCAAILDGKTVELGARYGQEKLIEVNQNGVVLQGAGGMRRLTLFPAVDLKVVDDNSSGRQMPRCRLEQKVTRESPDSLSGEKEKK